MWWHRFVNRQDAYALQYTVGSGCGYRVVYSPVSDFLFDQHLAGFVTLAVPAIDASGLSRWCCFDSDRDDGSLDRIHRLLREHRWHGVREGQRPGRAGHLWAFFDNALPAADLRLFGHRLIESAGVNAADIEFFPKQEGPGAKARSLVRLPLGIHRKPEAEGLRGWFRDAPQSLAEQIEYIDQQPFNPTAPILEAAPDLRRLAEAKRAHPYIGQPRSTPSACELERVRLALSFVPPHDYRTWIEVGMALKSGGIDLAVWEEWSARSPKYVPGICVEKWASFHGGQLGLGSLFYRARQNGFAFPPAFERS